MIKSDSESHFTQIFCVIVLLVVVVWTFVFENRVVGLEPGFDDLQPKHHGWVTANTLAIISKATPEHYFVGYALAFKDDQNRPQYEYFDRYPFFLVLYSIWPYPFQITWPINCILPSSS